MTQAVVHPGDTHPTLVFDLDAGLTMMIDANQAAIIDEIAAFDGVPEPVVVHAMTARDKFLRR